LGCNRPISAGHQRSRTGVRVASSSVGCLRAHQRRAGLVTLPGWATLRVTTP